MRRMTGVNPTTRPCCHSSLGCTTLAPSESWTCLSATYDPRMQAAEKNNSWKILAQHQQYHTLKITECCCFAVKLDLFVYHLPV